jgi:hypothetical protein
MSEVECETVEDGVERLGRCAPDLLNPNKASSGRARQDQPSLHMPDKICSGHATMDLCRARYRSGTGQQWPGWSRVMLPVRQKQKGR